MSTQISSNPFVGLRPFESDESLLFFGRQEQTLQLLQRLHQHHFVAVVGSSGSGKSSLIRAGLIPSLKAGYLVDDRDRWMITIMKPGQSPLYNLANALVDQLQPDAGELPVKNLLKKIKEEGADAVLNVIQNLWQEKNTNFFLLVDQFEELFRFSMDQKDIRKKDEAVDFVNIILELSKQTDVPVYVVITMRSDFIGDCAQFYGLPEAMNKSQYLVPRLNRVQLKNAIEGPVKLYGRYINPALTSRLLNDAGTVKDELPLLQHTLMRIWDHEINVDKNGELDLKDYEFIGGIEKALSNHADEALKDMNDEELLLTEKLFQALTAIDDNGRKIRRPVYLKELETITGAGKQQLLAIINKFIEDKRSFLVINKADEQDDEVIDISHESLIRQWGKLSAWVDEEGEAAKNYLRLTESSQLYKQHKKDLLGGSELQLACQWYNAFNPSIVWAKRYADCFEDSVRYLKESIKQKNLEEKKKKDRKTRQILYSAASVLAIIILLIFFNVKQSTLRAQAEKATHIAEEAKQIADDSTMSAKQQRKLADISANEARKQKDSADYNAGLASINAQNAIRQATLAKEALNRLAVESEKTNRQYNAFKLNALAYDWESKDATVALRLAEAAMQMDEDTIFLSTAKKIYERNSFYKTILKDSSDLDYHYSSFSDDGTKVLIKSDGRASIWNLEETGKKTPLYTIANDHLYRIRFSPDLSEVLTFSNDSAFLTNLNINKTLVSINTGEHVNYAYFSPDGKKIITESEKALFVWNTHNKKLMSINNTDAMGTPCISNDATKVVTESGFLNNPVFKLWDENKKGEKILNFALQKEKEVGSLNMNFSPDETKILAFKEDSSLRLLDIDSGKIIWSAKTQSQILNTYFSPDGKEIIANFNDNTFKLWKIGSNDFIQFKGHTKYINSIKFSADGRSILTASEDHTVRLWRTDGTLVTVFNAPDGIMSATFSPDNSKIIAGLSDGTVTTWISPVNLFTGHKNEINLVAYSPDKSKMEIITGSEDSTARLWMRGAY